MKKRANAKKGSSSPDEAEALEVVDLSAGKSLLVKKVVRRGTGPVVPRKSRVKVHYEGKLEEGDVTFDSSYKRGIPLDFKQGCSQVIRGWDICVGSMKKGEKVILTIHPEYGYGAEGIQGVIPGNSVLVFTMELVEFLPGNENETGWFSIVVMFALMASIAFSFYVMFASPSKPLVGEVVEEAPPLLVPQVVEVGGSSNEQMLNEHGFP